MGDRTFALINLNVDVGKLSEPATKVVELVGSVFEPTGIRRKAKAEGDAAITAALARETVQEIELRAAKRLLSFEVRRQENIEGIVGKAVDVADDVAKLLPPPEGEKDADAKVDEDWVYSFFEHCQDVKNEQMQILWAKLLAGEVVRPGSYSLKTLEVVKTLRQQDAEQFTRLCSFVWQTADGLVPIIEVEEDEEILSRVGPGFSTFLHLQSLGLIDFQSFPSFSLTSQTGRVDLAYHGRIYTLSSLPTFPCGSPSRMKSEKGIPVGNVLLTAVGKELAPLADPTPNEEYHERVLERWREEGIEVVEQSPDSLASESETQTDP